MKTTRTLTAGAIVAVAGMTMGAQAIDWAAAVDGNWNDAVNWLGADVPNVVGDDAVLGLSGMYTVSVTDNFTHGGLSITNPDAMLTLGSIFHTLNGDLLNDGLVVVNANGTNFNSHIAFGVDALISGGGEIVLNGNGSTPDAQIIVNPGFVATHASGHTIRGHGLLVGEMMNAGNIIGDSVVGGLEIGGMLTQSAGGNAGADGGMLLLASGSVVSGGELITLNGGVVEVSSGTATIGNITNSGDLNVPGNSRFLDINGPVINDGSIRVNQNGVVFNGHLRFITDTTLSGSGDVTMISLGDLGDAQILTANLVTATFGPNQTVQGSGLVASTTDGLIINQGIFNGNDPAVGLGLAGNHMGDGGVYRADNGTLLLRSGLVLSGGTFETSGTGSITRDAGGTATISDIVNNGLVNIVGGGTFVDLAGDMTNNGTISINSSLNVFNAHLVTSTDVTIGGVGSVLMDISNNINDAQIFTQADATLTFSAGQTVEGAGLISGDSDGTIENLGVINGNIGAVGKVPAKELHLFGNHTGSGIGEYRSDDGVLALGGGLVLDNGTFDSSGDGIVEVANSSSVTLSDVTNLGEMGIRGNGSFMRLAGPMVNNGTVTVNSNNAIFNGHLVFENASAAITGSGMVRLQTEGDLGDAQVFTEGAFDAIIGSGQTFAGFGQIDGRNDGTIVNNSLIDADVADQELRLRGNHDGSGGGIYRATDGVLGISTGLTMIGGTFETVGAGSVAMTTGGSAFLDSMVHTGTMDLRGDGGIVELTGPLTNNGTININSNLNIFNAHIRFQEDTVIDGAGLITMVTSTNLNDAQIIAADGFTGTVGSGQSIVGDGLLVGSLNINGMLDPAGRTRQFTIDNMAFAGSTEMVADLGGLLDGEFDRLVLGGGDTIELDGTLTVNLDDGYAPSFGDTWDIIDGGTVVGEFESSTMPEASIGLVYREIYESDRVYVVLTCNADLTGDNVLDFFDVSIFLNYFSGSDTRADINGDGSFDFFDVSLFLQIFSGGCN